VSLEAKEGRELVASFGSRGKAAPAVIGAACDAFDSSGDIEILLSDELAAAAAAAQDRSDITRSNSFPLLVGRPRARAGAWYKMIPRSQGTVPGSHGTSDDCIARLPEVAQRGFNIVYLTPIHPIGRINRKGRNNALVAGPDDPGSPYAIGADEGGHDAVHPELGT